MFRSIEVGAVKFWEQLLSGKLDINTQACTHNSEDGSVCYPLNVALGFQTEDLVKLLLKHDVDVHHRTCTVASSQLPLVQSILWGNTAIMRLILSRYEVPLSEASLENLAEAICGATFEGNLSCLEELCSYGKGKGDKTKDQRFAFTKGYIRKTAMHAAVAAKTNQEQSIALLLKHGANINDLEENGYTPLHIAAGLGKCSVIRTLVENGAHIHARSQYMTTPILRAAENFHLEAVKLLYELGACLEDRDICGQNLLLFFARESPPKAMPILAWLTAKLPWRTYLTYEGASLLDHAIAGSTGDFSAVIYLVENGADLLKISRKDGSVIHLSAHYGHTWLAERFLQLIPPDKLSELLEYSSEYHGTALYAASGQGHTKIVEMLLSAGASIDTWSSVLSGPDTGGTALMIACANGHEGVVRLLLSKGARMSVVNSEGVEGSALKVARARCRRTLRILQEWEAATTDRCSYFVD